MSQFIVKLVTLLVALIPLFFLNFFLKILLFAFSKKSKDYSFLKKNIEVILGLKEDTKASKVFITKCMSHFIFTFCEIIKYISLGKKIVFQGMDSFRSHVEESEAEGDGNFLLVTAHLGSWDLVGHSASLCSKGPFYALAKPSKSFLAQKFIGYMRGVLQIHLLLTGKQNFQKNLIKTIKEKGSVAFLVDQKPNKGSGIEVDFLGRKTPFVKGPAFIAKKYKKPIVIGFCLRKSFFCYELRSEKISLKEIESSSIEELTQIFADRISDEILKNPEQWAWSYKRWSF